MVYKVHLPGRQVLSAEGHESATACAPLSFPKPSRVSFYIDGFNLYHAIDALNDNRLKWLDLRSLCESYLRPGNAIERIVFFTAINTWDPTKRERHLRYVNALEVTGVEVVRGSFDRPTKFCNSHQRWCRNHGEKKTDVGIAVNLIADGFENKYHVAFLMSADSDHVPLAKRFNLSLPNKHLFVIAPPGRIGQASELVQAVGRPAFQLTEGRLRSHLLPAELRNDTGRLLVARPSFYGAHE